MKKLLVVLTVLAMATVANAYTVKISVGGVVDPPDTQINLLPSEWTTIDIHVTDNAGWPLGGVPGLLIMQGPGAITVPVPPELYLWESSTIANAARPEPYDTYKAYLEGAYPGITDVLEYYVGDAVEPFSIPLGRVIDGVKFHCEAIGDVTLTLMDLDLNVLDTQVIHQIPEPMTMVLLGLGGLFLRRRK